MRLQLGRPRRRFASEVRRTSMFTSGVCRSTPTFRATGRDCGHDPASDQARSALVLAREDEDRVALLDLLPPYIVFARGT
jgi:hypothetical protein